MSPKHGQFAGYAAYFGNEDRNGDILDRGAFALTLRESGSEFPLLWQHDATDPIGVVKAQEDSRGLRVVGALNLENHRGRSAWGLMNPPEGFSHGGLRGMSIGYRTREEEFRGGRRHLADVELFEVSLVTIPANPRTLIDKIGAEKSALDVYTGDDLISDPVPDEVAANFVETSSVSPADIRSLAAEIQAFSSSVRSAIPRSDDNDAVRSDARALLCDIHRYLSRNSIRRISL